MREHSVTFSVLGAALVLALLAVPALAGSKQRTGNQKTERFRVIAPHTPESCLKALDDVAAASPKLLNQFDWGCMAGDHTGYLEISAESEAAVRDLLPPSLRDSAKIIKLNKFTLDQIQSFHHNK